MCFSMIKIVFQMNQNRNGDNQVIIYNFIWACCSAYCTVSITNWSHLILTFVSFITAKYTFDKLFILLIVQNILSVGWTYILIWTDWEVTQPTDVTHVSLIVYQTLRYSCSWNDTALRYGMMIGTCICYLWWQS